MALALPIVILALAMVWAGRRAAVAAGTAPALARTLGPLRAVGCWALYDSRGRPAEGRLHSAPSIALLQRDRYVVRFDSLGRRMPKHGWSTWSADSLSDSIRVTTNDGFMRTTFVLDLPVPGAADTIRGRAYEETHRHTRRLRGRVFAVRTPCPQE